jgi:hypothetical protein
VTLKAALRKWQRMLVEIRPFEPTHLLVQRDGFQHAKIARGKEALLDAATMVNA